MSAADNIVSFVRGFGQRKQAAQISDAMSNYLTDPEASIKAVSAIDPETGIALNAKHQADVAAQAQAQQAAADHQFGAFKSATSYLRGLPAGTDYGHAIDQMAPFLTSTLGATPDQLNQWKGVIQQNPDIINQMDDAAHKEMVKAQFGAHVLTPGSALDIGGVRKDYVPFQQKPVTLHGGDGSSTLYNYDPNTGTIGGGTSTPGAPVAASAAGGSTQRYTGGWTPRARNGGDNPDDVVDSKIATMGSRLGMGATDTLDPASAGRVAGVIAMTEGGPGSIGYRNNNRTNIRDGAFAQSQPGYVGTGAGGYAKFDTDANGLAAGAALVRRKIANGQNTIQSLIEGVPAGGGAPVPAPAATGGALATTAPKPSKAGTVRAATPQELNGYPAGTMAQMDTSTGKLVNIKTPSAQTQKDNATAANAPASYQHGMTELNTLRQYLVQLRDDPRLANATGYSGQVSSLLHSPGAQDLHSLAEQINAMKMVNLVQYMKNSGGNPFSRITNQEAMTLPKTLAPLDFTQSTAGFKSSINRGLAQIDQMTGEMKADAQRRGYIGGGGGGAAAPAPAGGKIMRNPQTGAMIQFNGKGWVPYRGN